MISRYWGRVGEYMWEKEQERLNRYKDRPWELQSREPRDNALFAFLFIALGMLAGLLLFSLFL